MKKITMLCAAMVVVSATTLAQEISCKKLDAVTTSQELTDKNMASVTFESGERGWTIEFVNKNVEGDKRQGERTLQADEAVGAKTNTVAYTFLFNVSEDNERTFVISKMGSPMSAKCVAKALKPGSQVTYQLDELDDKLARIEAQKNETMGVYPKEGMACVEITTMLSELKISTGWESTETKSASDARVITIVVDINRLKALLQTVQELKAKSKSLEDAGDYLALGDVDKELETRENEYVQLSNIVVGGEGIKSITLSLSDLGLKEKRRYAIIALTETYESLLTHARQLAAEKNHHTDYGFYESMIITYDKAIGHKDAPHDSLAALQAERNDMALLRKRFYLMGKALELADKAMSAGNDSAEYKNLSARCKLAELVMKNHPEIEGVDEIYQNTNSRRENHPLHKNKRKEEVVDKHQVISGKVEKGDSYLLDPRGMRVFQAGWPGKVKPKERGKVLGKIGQDNTFRIVLEEPVDYIIIEGESRSRSITPETSDMGTLVLESH